MIVSGGFLSCTLIVGLVVAVLCQESSTESIFRDQLMPLLGGKIPDSAFNPERLYSNRLNKNGIYISDGVYLEERHPERHNFPRAFLPNTIKLKIPADNKHVAKPGRMYHWKIIDTTYLIQDSVQISLPPPHLDYGNLPVIPRHSLKLSYMGRMRKNPPEFESMQIFQSYLPFLKSMHEIYDD